MTREDIVDRIKKLNNISSSVLAVVYFILKKEADYELVLADIEHSAQKEIAALYLGSLNEMINDEEETVLNLSMADDRRKAIYLYDLPEYSGLLLKIKTPLKNSIRTFNFKEDKFDEIFGFIIKTGIEENFFTIFKKNYPVSLIKKSSFSLMRLNNTERLSKVNDDILKLNFSIDFFIVENALYIKNIDVLEKYFNFTEIIKKEAMKSLETIAKTKLVDDIDSMRNNIENISFSRKLVKATYSSNVLNKIPQKEIVEYSKANIFYKGKFKYNKKGDKFLLSTKKSQQFFLKLINDEILLSELTKIHYDSLAKDEIIIPKIDGAAK
jgi:hypothetical protein